MRIVDEEACIDVLYIWEVPTEIIDVQIAVTKMKGHKKKQLKTMLLPLIEWSALQCPLPSILYQVQVCSLYVPLQIIYFKLIFLICVCNNRRNP